MIYAMLQYLQSHSLTWLFSGRETQYICVGQKDLFFFFIGFFLLNTVIFLKIISSYAMKKCGNRVKIRYMINR